MHRQIGFGLLFILVCAATGVVFGWATAPQYRPPEAAGEARLRERAERFYHAMQVFDFLTMSQLYTPARQLADAAELREIATDRADLFLRMQPETRAEQLASVSTIHAAGLDVELEGDWAVTNGTRSIFEGDREIKVALDEVAWVRVVGDWWVYQWKTSELVAYGNPPDFAREMFIDKNAQGILDTSPEQDGAGGRP